MKGYLIAALKVTPVFPTFTEARDALLAVAFANDVADYVVFRVAFARRGAGAEAVSPDRFSTDNTGVVEDFAAGPDLALEGATFDDSLGACDADDVVDHGEYGLLTVTLRNTGTTELTDTSATISSPSSDVWFPLGTSISFPTIPVAGTAFATLRIAYLESVSGIQQLDFQIDYTDAQLSTPLTDTVEFRANTDEIPASTATDTVEPATSPTTTGFNATFGDIAPWQRVELNPLAHHWHVDDADVGSDQYLISPVMTVDGSGAFNVQFDHSWRELGGSVTYTIVAANLGPDDIIGATVSDAFPADLTCAWTCAGAGGGACAAAGTGDIQDGTSCCRPAPRPPTPRRARCRSRL